MARRVGKARGKAALFPKGKNPPLKLLRVEPGRRKGVMLVFESEGAEHGWLLEQTTVTELLALLLRGRMRGGRRIELDAAEIMIEPPPKLADDPILCIAMGPLELCASVDRATAKALKMDLDRAIRRLN